MQRTKIPWSEYTWNPTIGCPIPIASIGCAQCYARILHNNRHRAFLAGKKLPKQYAKPFEEIQLFPDRLDAPLRKRKPCTIFVGSMTDLFAPGVPFAFIDKVWDVMMYKAPQHDYQILTKRPERMAEYVHENPYDSGNIWLGTTCENQEMADLRIPQLLQIPATVRFVSVEPMLGPVDLNELHLDEYYCPQCEEFFSEPGRWVSSCCGADTSGAGHSNGTCQIICPECKNAFEEDEEIPECPTCKNQGGGRYIQPDFSQCFSRDLEGVALKKLDWVIIGPENGPGKRPFKIEWARDLVAQCDAAGVPVFIKPSEWLEWPDDLKDRQEYPK